MEGIKSHPVGQGCRLNFTKEKPPLSSPGCDQRFLDRSSTEKVYSADEITVCDLKLMNVRHSCGCTNKALRKHKLSEAGNGQRCYIYKKIQNGTQQMCRFSFSVHLWNYIMMLLPLLVIISSINSVTSNDDLCQNATWTSEVKCNCSVNMLNSSSCGKIVTEQNETLYSCQCGNNIVCNIDVTYANGSQNFGNCSCEKGYTGLNCELLSTNYCENVTCLNGGTCIELLSNSSYSCNCSSGFSGEHCEQDMDVCNDTNYCENNGSCVNDGFGEYMCNCTEGYEGFNCSLPNCTHVECANGGTCDILNDKWLCNCTEGFEGADCSVFNGCLSSPCSNNGSCVHVNETFYRCNCSHGFMGVNCDERDSCASSPCRYGNCSNEDQSFKCSCNASYSGIYCNLTNPCSDHVCENGGSCIDLLQNASDSNGDCSIPGNCFSCTCTANFTGSLCETQVTVPGEPQENELPVALIVGLTVGLLFLLLIIVGIIVILVILKKRKNLGTYHPSRQEFANARLEINGGLKPPPEERLI